MAGWQGGRWISKGRCWQGQRDGLSVWLHVDALRDNPRKIMGSLGRGEARGREGGREEGMEERQLVDGWMEGRDGEGRDGEGLSYSEVHVSTDLGYGDVSFIYLL